jgi:hypothetical protein
MTGNYQLIRTLEDYQRFLRHSDPMIRDWAAKRIEAQYPDQAAENLAGLVNDPDPHLQITAARAIGDSGDPRYEPALLAVYPETEGYVRNWFMTTLAKLGSRTLLPQLVAELEAAPAEEREVLALRSLAEAVGCYPDQAARSALWHFVETYVDDDWATYAAFEGLLNLPEPDTVLRLVRRYGQLKPRPESVWRHAIIALADAIGVGRLTQETATKIPEGPYPALWQVDDWLDQDIVYSETFEDALEEAEERSYAEVLPHVLAELERVLAERGDDLAAWLEGWRAGQPPTGYCWRTLYTQQVIAALAEYPPPGEKSYQEGVALALALLGQALTDENDEALLQAAPDGADRRAVLLHILSSPRQNVMPDVIDQVIALGPDVIPDLIEVLEGDEFWPQPRTLQALARIARPHPAAAEPAIMPILDLIDENQSDYVLEPAQEALVAIGPPVIDLAAARLGQDYVYDIYAGSVLAEIPAQASAEALMKYVDASGALEEGEAEELAALGHPSAIPFLQRYYTPGDGLLATILHKLAVVTGYTGPERIEWWATAVNHYAAFIRASTVREPTWLFAPEAASSVGNRKPDGDETKPKKREPFQTRAERTRQRQQKKKKRRR